MSCAETLFAEPTVSTPATAIETKPAAKPSQSCRDCAIRRACAMQSERPAKREHLAALELAHHRVKKGETLFRAGDRFTSLYVVRSGSFKKSMVLADGREQITGFYFPGDAMALSAMHGGAHSSDAIALEDSAVCVVPSSVLESLSERVRSMGRHWHRMLSAAIVRGGGALVMLGSMTAEQRVAAFLLDLSDRWRGRGYSAVEFVLKMTRSEIGCYLGLKTETVSRVLQSMHRRGILDVHTSEIHILDLPGLILL